MLKFLRHKKTAKKIWIVLAILILPAFIFWGLGSSSRNQNENDYAGSIFGKKITLIEYRDAMNAVRNQMIMQFGDNFQKMKQYLNLENQAWERLLLIYEAKRRKIKATDKEVIERIQKYPFFQRKDRFDDKIYAELLQYVFNTQPRVFEEETRSNIMLSKLFDQLTNKITVDEQELKDGYRKLNEELTLSYIASLPVDFKNTIAPSEQELRDYFDNNSVDFKQPLSFNIEFLATDSPDKLKKNFSKLYKAKDFKKAAGALGFEVKETGLFPQEGPIPGIGWSPQVISQIVKLKSGQFAPILNLDNKYYLLKIKERKEPFIPDFTGSKDRVKETFIKNKSLEIAKTKITNCLKELNDLNKISPKLVNFTKSAKEFGLKFNTTQPFKFASYIEGIGESNTFWTQAKDLKDGEFSSIIEMPSGFYIVEVKNRTSIDPNKFEKEKEEFSQRVLLQKKSETFGKFIEELKNKAQLY